MGLTANVHLYIAASVEGLIADVDGGLKWLFENPNNSGDGEAYGCADFYESADVLVMGRATYQMIVDLGEWLYEVTFEEYFTWWYHLYYSAVTDRLVARKRIDIPRSGITTYVFVPGNEWMPHVGANPLLARAAGAFRGEDDWHTRSVGHGRAPMRDSDRSHNPACEPSPTARFLRPV